MGDCYKQAGAKCQGGYTMLDRVVSATGRSIDRLRKRRQEGESLPEEAWADIEDEGPGPLQNVMADADARRLGKCLDHLDEKQRESVSLAFFHGMTHSELATHLATPLGTVKAWVRRGLEKLRHCLGEAAA